MQQTLWPGGFCCRTLWPTPHYSIMDPGLPMTIVKALIHRCGRVLTASTRKLKPCRPCSTSTKVAATLFRWSTKDPLHYYSRWQNIKNARCCCKPTAISQFCRRAAILDQGHKMKYSQSIWWCSASQCVHPWPIARKIAEVNPEDGLRPRHTATITIMENDIENYNDK